MILSTSHDFLSSHDNCVLAFVSEIKKDKEKQNGMQHTHTKV